MAPNSHQKYDSLSSSIELPYDGLPYDLSDEPPSPILAAHPTAPLMTPSNSFPTDFDSPDQLRNSGSSGSYHGSPRSHHSNDSRHNLVVPDRTPHHEPSPSFDDLPVSATEPRFLVTTGGYNDPSAPIPRDSFQSDIYNPYSQPNTYANSSQNLYPSHSPNPVYGLNPRMAMGRQGLGGNGNGSYASYRDEPMDSFYSGSEAALPLGFHSGTSPQQRSVTEKMKRQTYIAPRKKSKRTCLIWTFVIFILALIGAGVGVYFGVFRKSSNNNKSASSSTPGTNSSSSSSPSQNTTTPAQQVLVSGGDGSIVTMDDGTTFTYSNKFGGVWYYDETDPFNNNAQAQSWSPPLNTSMKYGRDRIRGVNIGGWLTLEPFVTPALFEKYHSNNVPPVDEWVLSEAMAGDTRPGGGLSQIESHYKTFITEKDFAEIAGAGLNYVRIGLPWWAIEVRGKEPFLEGVAWTYFLKAIKWARKYGIRINLDFHAVPGSQNGWNHSGRLGSVNMLAGPMGLANAQRTLDYTRIIAEFISQPQYKNVVTMFGILNEPLGSPAIGKENMQRYYLQAYKKIRVAGGIGEMNGPVISLHEAFVGLGAWPGVFPNADRLALDYHPYLCFGTTSQSNAPMSTYANTPCDAWGATMNSSMTNFGLTIAGEWSLAVTDCGKWLTGVDLGTRYEATAPYDNLTPAGKCSDWTNYPTWSQALKNDYKVFAMASMDALQNWFFWTWKIGNSSVTGKVESPHWSYQLGLQQGFIPADPRAANGQCRNPNPWSGQLQSWQTGGQGANNIPAAATAGIGWPPTSIAGGFDAAALPSYTPTGPIPTLAGPSLTITGSVTPAAITIGNGWNQPTDTAGAQVEIAGCYYLDPWIGAGSPPSPLCNGGPRRRNASSPPAPTPAP